MSEGVELDDLYLRYEDQRQEGDEGYEETNFDDNDEEVSWNTEWDGLTNDSVQPTTNHQYDVRTFKVRNIKFILENIKDNPSEYSSDGFINYLINNHEFKFRKGVTDHNVIYLVEYYGRQYNDNTGGIVRPYRKFLLRNKEIKGAFNSDFNRAQFNSDIDRLYDKYKSEILKRELKRVGLAGGVVIAITSLISGLILGLKRSGRDMIHNSEIKLKKLTPAERKKVIIPWTALEKASGKGVIIIGEYFYVILGGLVIIYTVE